MQCPLEKCESVIKALLSGMFRCLDNKKKNETQIIFSCEQFFVFMVSQFRVFVFRPFLTCLWVDRTYSTDRYRLSPTILYYAYARRSKG